MSRRDRKRGREKNAEGEFEEEQSYTRADASLWDDSALVKLWNEQLGKMSSTGGSASDKEASSPASESGSSVSDGSSRNQTQSARSAEDSWRPSLSLAHLPQEVQRLVRSFYNAGYEAGLYAAAVKAKK